MIYFIKHTKYVKIGYTTNIQDRLYKLQVSCPVRLKIVGLIDGDLSDESSYHEKFKHLHSNGEWFEYTQEIALFIEGLSKSMLWKYGFEDSNDSSIGEIERCRLAKNMSKEQLGLLLGISRQAVLDMEKREVQGKISINTLSKTLEVMGFIYQYRSLPK